MEEKNNNNEQTTIELQLTAYNKLQKVRKELQEAKLKKSGHNDFQHYDYFTLDDIVPKATELFDKYGLTPIFNVSIDENGVEYATLDIIDNSSVIRFKSPTANPNSKDPIQALGSKITYMRRYLYLMALDVVEPDTVDNQDNTKTVEEKVDYASEYQVTQIKTYGKLISKELAEKKVKTVNQIKELTLEEASKLVELINERIASNGKEE